MAELNTSEQDIVLEKLNGLRESYIEFMNKLNSIGVISSQKHHAFVRFEEGHMWMQNAILASHLPQTTEEVKND